MLLSLFASSVIDENTAHGLSRRCEEMAATVPILVFCTDQTDICFVDERRCLERLAGPFL
jgi:hypothetical protein